MPISDRELIAIRAAISVGESPDPDSAVKAIVRDLRSHTHAARELLHSLRDRELLKAYRRADGDKVNFNSGYWWQLGSAADDDLRSKITHEPLAPKA